MAFTITHSTAADGTFSASGTTAWDANHTIAGNVAIGDTLTGATAARIIYAGAGPVFADSANLTFDPTGSLLTLGTDAVISRTASKQVMIAGDGTGATTNAGLTLGYAAQSGFGGIIYSGGTLSAATDTYNFLASSTTTYVGAPNAAGAVYLTVNGATIAQLGPAAFALAAGSAFTHGAAAAAGATTTTRIIKKVTGIADNTATDVFTVTVPNANHSAGVKVRLVSSNGGTDAFESTRVAEGFVVLARTSGANAVAGVAALTHAQIATVSGGATHTLAYGVSAISGAVGAVNTFTIQVTIDDSGNLGSNQVVAVAEIINSEATGVTIA